MNQSVYVHFFFTSTGKTNASYWGHLHCDPGRENKYKLSGPFTLWPTAGKQMQIIGDIYAVTQASPHCCFYIFFFVIHPDRNSGSSDVHGCTLEVLHRAIDLLPYRCVSRRSFCCLVLVILTVPQEVFHCHGWCTTVACKGFSNTEVCEHVVPKSWMSSS